MKNPFLNRAGVTPGVEELAKQGIKMTGLPAGHKGVETQAKEMLNLDQGPMPPMIVNGRARFTPPTAPENGRAGYVAPSATPMQFQGAAKPNAPMQDLGEQPVSVMPPTRGQGAAAPRMNPLSLGAAAGAASGLGTSITPPNSLSRGARPGSASGLGGPVRVGRSANDPMRIAETARRRGNIGPMMDLAKMQMQEDRADARTLRSEGRADARYEQGRMDRFNEWTQSQAAAAAQEERQTLREDQRFERDTQRRANESSVEWERRKLIMAQEEAARGDPTQVRAVPVPGTDYVIPYAGNQAMGTLKTSQPNMPIPAGLVPQGAVRDGIQYGPAQTAADAKQPAFTYEKDPNGKITGAVYPEQDPQTGKWMLRRADLNGDGVVDPQEKLRADEAAKAAALAAPAAAGQPVKTKAGNSYTFK